jgi:hypothetical protein
LPSHLWGGKDNKSTGALAKITDNFLKAISLVNGESILTADYSPITHYACILNISKLTLYRNATHTKTFPVFPWAHFYE